MLKVMIFGRTKYCAFMVDFDLRWIRHCMQIVAGVRALVQSMIKMEDASRFRCERINIPVMSAGTGPQYFQCEWLHGEVDLKINTQKKKRKPDWHLNSASQKTFTTTRQQDLDISHSPLEESNWIYEGHRQYWIFEGHRHKDSQTAWTEGGLQDKSWLLSTKTEFSEKYSSYELSPKWFNGRKL